MRKTMLCMFIVLAAFLTGAMAQEQPAKIFVAGFDEGKGTTLSDSSGNRYNAAIKGCTWISKKSGKALLFDGISSLVELPQLPALNLKMRDNFTVEMWVKPDVLQTAKYPRLLSAKGGVEIHITKEAPFTLCINQYIGGKLKQLAVANLKGDEWTHIVYTNDGAKSKCYLNGKLAKEQACPGPLDPCNNPICLGAVYDASAPYKGAIGHCAIYQGVMSPENVSSSYNATCVQYTDTKTTADAAQPALSWVWNKNGDFKGWVPLNHEKISAADGKILAFTKRDFWLTSPVLAVDTAQYSRVQFRLKSNTSGRGQIYFSQDGRITAANYLPFNVMGDGVFHTYEVDMATHQGWKGIVTKIRFDPIDDAGTELEIEWFKLLNAKDAEGVAGVLRGGSSPVKNTKAPVQSMSAFLDIPLTAGNGMLQLIGSTDNLIPGSEYTLCFGYQTPGAAKNNLSITFRDVEGRSLIDKFAWNLPSAQQNFETRFTVPATAATTSIKVVSDKGFGSFDKLHMQKMPQAGIWQSSWIWYPEELSAQYAERYFRKKFTATGDISEAWVQVTADDSYSLYINGLPVESGAGWATPEIYDVTGKLKKGDNVIAASVRNYGGAAGFLCELFIKYKSGSTATICTDGTWASAKNKETGWNNLQFNDSSWKLSLSMGIVPAKPWGSIPYFSFIKKDNIKEHAQPLAKTFAKINKESAIRAQVKRTPAGPAMYINDREIFPMFSKGTSLEKRFVTEYKESGVHYHIPFWPYVGLQENGKCDFSEVDAIAAQTLSADPDARMIFIVELNSKDFWDRLHPDDVTVFSDGTKGHQSLASKTWKEDFGSALEQFIRHINSSPYAKRVAGYMVEATKSEWQYWGCEDNKFADYSPSMRDAFISWLKNKYNNDPKLLAKAWGVPGLDFDKVQIPSQAERQHKDFYIFRDPLKSRNVIDYLSCHSDVAADSILYFARIVKKETKNAAVCGVYYGYTLEHAGLGYKFLHGGHLALRKVLDSPDIDFVASPVTYRMRKVGDPGGFMIPKASADIHAKMLFNEADMRTYLAVEDSGYGRTSNLKTTVEVLKREYAYMLTEGIGLWWYDMKGGWFSNKAILDMFDKAERIGLDSVKKQKKPCAEIAVIVDEKSPLYMSLDTSGFNNEALSMQRNALARMGAPYDCYLLSDVLDKDIPEYKLYIFLNAFYLKPGEIDTLKNKLQKNGRILCWVYAPGFVNDDGFSLNNISRLTSIKIGCDNKPGRLMVDITNGIGDNGIIGTNYGVDGRLGPIFFADDPSATVLGTLKEDGKPGLVMKKLAGFTSIYSAAPNLPYGLLKSIAKTAGVHIYTDSGDSISVNSRYLSIHTAKGGEKTIRLPQTCSPYEPFKNKYFGKACRDFKFDAEDNSTYIFELQ